MREIKFRAYVKETEEMYKVIDLDIGSEQVALKGLLYLRKFDEVELMQYTGLKDMYNAPIYEGDILKHITNCEQVGVVSFKKSSFYLTLDEQDGCFYLDNCNEVCKIIGNIYQNPELLN